MAETFNKDMNIIARSDMEIQVDPFTKDMNIIQKLDDEPNDVGGLSAQQLKAKFDEGGNALKDYINNSLIPQVLSDGANEAQRQINEADREANETQRQANETARQSAETARAAAEEARDLWEDYDAAKSYVPGNKVYYQGSSYVNIAGCQGLEPTNTEHWQIIAKKGADGEGSLSPEEADLRYLKLSGGTMTGHIKFTQEPLEETGSMGMGAAGGMDYSGHYLIVSGVKLLPFQGLEMLGRRIEHVGDPTETGDAVNKNYFDNIVQCKTIPFKSVTLEASALQAYIDALPRLLTEYLAISVNAGHVPETLRLENFYGAGSISVSGPGANSGVLDNGINIEGCSVPIFVSRFDIRGSSVNFAISVSWSQKVSLVYMTADRSHFSSGGTNIFGARINYLSCVSLTECAFSGMNIATYCENAFARILSCSGSGNSLGVAVESGGVIMMSGTTPELMGGASNGKWGGMIVKKDGTLL